MADPADWDGLQLSADDVLADLHTVASAATQLGAVETLDDPAASLQFGEVPPVPARAAEARSEDVLALQRRLHALALNCGVLLEAATVSEWSADELQGVLATDNWQTALVDGGGTPDAESSKTAMALDEELRRTVPRHWQAWDEDAYLACTRACDSCGKVIKAMDTWEQQLELLHTLGSSELWTPDMANSSLHIHVTDANLLVPVAWLHQHTGRMRTTKDAGHRQAKLDVERDQVRVNGVLYKGSDGYDAIVNVIMTALKTPERHLWPRGHDRAMSSELCSELAQTVLRFANRTESGGDSLDAIVNLVAHPWQALIMPIADSAHPIELHVDVGPFQTRVHGHASWHWGVRIHVECSTAYDICRNDPDSDATPTASAQVTAAYSHVMGIGLPTHTPGAEGAAAQLTTCGLGGQILLRVVPAAHGAVE